MRKASRLAAILCLAASALATAAPAQAQTYWRVDVGWSRAKDKANFKDNDFDAAGVIWASPSAEPAVLNNFDDSSIIGGGVGYRLTSALRGDVTLAYRGFYNLNDSTFEADYHVRLTSTTLMVNGYYDFTAGGVRPYLGAGIGWARNETDRLSQDFRLGFANTFGGAATENGAVALMAGVGIPFRGVTLDIGYRYIDLGKFSTAAVAALGMSSGQTGKLSAHELTLGVRF
jgi:opacity protein-like surface antigen